MVNDDTENRTTEERTETPPVIADESIAPRRRGRKAEAADQPVASHEKDRGEWKFRPWHGHDHWVNERTGASTFDLKKVR